jgi:hypothetical protein
MAVMCIIHAQPDDLDASLVSSHDTRGLEVSNDDGYDRARWIEVGPADQPCTSVVPAQQAADDRILSDVETFLEAGAAVAG